MIGMASRRGRSSPGRDLSSSHAEQRAEQPRPSGSGKHHEPAIPPLLDFDMLQTGHGMLTVDDRFTVYLNGRELGSHANWSTGREFPGVGSLLKPGTNVLAVRGENGPGPKGANPAGLACGLAIRFADGSTTSVRSPRRPEQHSHFLVHLGDRHYVVYWDLFTRAQWQARETEYAAELAQRKELESRTVDLVNPGEEQNERDHKFAAEKSETGVFGNRGWRHADDGGWFRYVLKVLPARPQELSVTYWGSAADRRVFDILVDGRKLATETLENNRPDRFYDQTYALSGELTKARTRSP